MATIIPFRVFLARLRRRARPASLRGAFRRLWISSLDSLGEYLKMLQKKEKEVDATRKDLTIEAPQGEAHIVMTRSFAAPRSLVWKAISQPEHLIRWWGPHRHANKVLAFDWRVGGTWRIQSTTPEGQVIIFHGEFREIEPEWKLVQTFGVEGMFDGGYSIDTVTLEEVDGKTIYRNFSVLPDVASRDGMLASGMEVGVVEGFERLDAILEEFKAGPQ